MKRIKFSRHALDQLADRGPLKQELESAIREGERVPAKKGRTAFRKNFAFKNVWKGKKYDVKLVMPVVVEEEDEYIVVTVYVFYFREAKT